MDFYDDYWAGLEKLSAYKARRAAWMLQTLVTARNLVTGPMKVLDFGCGDGRLVSFWNEVGDAVGIDLSLSAMKRAKARYAFLSYCCGDATNAPFRDESFNVVVSHEVLEHVADQGAYLKEAHRLLAHGGVLVLTTPNKSYFDRRTGGNWSHQPIEELLSFRDARKLVGAKFQIIRSETLITARADRGIYRVTQNRLWLAALRRLGMLDVWHRTLERAGLGVHTAILATKRDDQTH